jgi:3-phosphoshikimate 1-carboxyvinyltransferase
VKESDRVAVLARAFSALGASVHERPDGLDIEPLAAAPAGRFVLDPEDDHRMAMAFGVLSLRIPGIEVTSPGCVSKSFPDFWSELDKLKNRP